jgi:V8-like Glu-specific endopeptidase
MARLSSDDRTQLLSLLQALPELQEAEGRRQILITAGLAEVLPLVNLQGRPFVVLSALIEKLETYGRVTYQHEALGLFLAVVKQLLGPAGDQRRFLDHLLTAYSLMTPATEAPEVPRWGSDPNPAEVREKIIGENTLRPIAFLQRALEAARAVAFIDVGRWVGTGFLVGRNLLLTNNHVLPSPQDLPETAFRFNYQLTFDGKEEKVQEYRAAASGLFHTNKDLDYTVVELDGSPGTDWGVLAVSPRVPRKGGRVNIIQHPGGLPKQISLQNNFVEYVDATVVQYLTATLPGSSGSPVLDDHWEVAALHHAGGMILEPATSRKYFRNEGILLSAILKDLPQQVRALLSIP